MKTLKKNYRHYNRSLEAADVASQRRIAPAIVGLATVHLVWIPCRRKRIFTIKNEAMKLRCIDIFNSVASEKKWVIKALEVAPDHIHLLVEYDPFHSISQVIKAFKGRSSRYLRQEFPALMKLPSLWTNSYMFDTTGKISTSVVLAYINDPHHG